MIELVLEVRHAYADYDVVLAVYRCDTSGGEPECRSVAELAWVAPEDLGNYAFPGADQRTVAALLSAED